MSYRDLVNLYNEGKPIRVYAANVKVGEFYIPDEWIQQLRRALVRQAWRLWYRGERIRKRRGN